jgi:hypothetical protein
MVCSFVSTSVPNCFLLFRKDLCPTTSWSNGKTCQGYSLHYKSSYECNFVLWIFVTQWLSVPLKYAYYHSIHFHMKHEESISSFSEWNSVRWLYSFHGWITAIYDNKNDSYVAWSHHRVLYGRNVSSSENIFPIFSTCWKNGNIQFKEKKLLQPPRIELGFVGSLSYGMDESGIYSRQGQ